MAEEQVNEPIPTYGYSEDEPKLFYLKPGKKLPKGYYANPAMVPGSDAEKRHREDAEREGAAVAWDAPISAPATEPAADVAPEVVALPIGARAPGPAIALDTVPEPSEDK